MTSVSAQANFTGSMVPEAPNIDQIIMGYALLQHDWAGKANALRYFISLAHYLISLLFV